MPSARRGSLRASRMGITPKEQGARSKELGAWRLGADFGCLRFKAVLEASDRTDGTRYAGSFLGDSQTIACLGVISACGFARITESGNCSSGDFVGHTGSGITFTEDKPEIVGSGLSSIRDFDRIAGSAAGSTHGFGRIEGSGGSSAGDFAGIAGSGGSGTGSGAETRFFQAGTSQNRISAHGTHGLSRNSLQKAS